MCHGGHIFSEPIYRQMTPAEESLMLGAVDLFMDGILTSTDIPAYFVGKVHGDPAHFATQTISMADRIQALEVRTQALEVRNQELEESIQHLQSRVVALENGLVGKGLYASFVQERDAMRNVGCKQTVMTNSWW